MNGLLKTHTNSEMRKAIRREVQRDIARHRGWYIFEGILFLLLAGLIVFLPGLTALTVQVVVAALLIVGGVFRILQALRTANSRWWRGVMGLIYAGVGATMLIWPTLGLFALIWAIGILLVVEGAFEIVTAFTIKPIKSWGWLLAAGIVSLVLGFFVLTEFPLAGVLYIAIALALSMALYGSSLLALAWNAETV